MATHATTRARRWIEAAIRDSRGAGHAKLPTVREMAASAGVAYGTMAAVVRELKRAGKVRSEGRRGLFAAGPGVPESSPSPPMASARWQRTAGQIESDIINGAFQPGELLPTYKELESNYHANFRTLKKAMGLLSQRGVVHEQGRRFAVSRPMASPARNTIALISGIGVSGRGLDFLPRRIQEHYRGLEEECSLSGVSLEVVDMRALAANPSSAKERLSHGVLGCLVWTAYTARDIIESCISSLPNGMPVALLDESGAFRGAEFSPLARGPFRFYTLGTGTHDGTIVGRYLLGLGHRSIAWISPHRGDHWSFGREGGVKRAFEHVGSGGDAVNVFGFALSSTEMEEWYRGAHVRRALDSLETTFGHVRFASDPHAQQTLSFVQGLRQQQTDSVGRRLESEFERALSDPSITAWACSSDSVAVRALAWLAERGVDVPGRLSVVGFDDSIDAFFAGLTSYNFNVPAVTRAMVNHVLSRPRRVGLRQERAFSARGYVTVRSSTSVKQAPNPKP